MRRRGGQGGPDGDPEESDRERRERARRERERARRRLAEKAGGPAVDDEAEPESKTKAKSAKPKAEPNGKAARPKPTAKAKAAKAASEGKAKPAQAKPKTTGKGAKAARPQDAKPSKPKDRKPSRPKAKAKQGGALVALKQGVAATRKRTEGVPTRVGGVVLKALGAAAAVFFGILGFVLNLLIGVVAFLRGPALAALRALAAAIRKASALVTPRRALAAVVAGAAILLALSQFADYRSVSVGTDAYADVETVAPAPEKERDETGSAHGYAMVPLAAIALALLAAALVRRRPALCRAIAAIGVIAVLVALLVDRPAGLDPGDLEEAFDGVRAQLLGGFYAQLFAGALLTGSSLLLARELRPAPERQRSPEKERRPQRRRPRPPQKAEGARA